MSTALDRATEVGVDLGADVPCSRKDCPEPAVWRGRFRCPSRHPWFPICATHRPAIDAQFAAAARPSGLLTCAEHGNRHIIRPPYVDWRAL